MFNALKKCFFKVEEREASLFLHNHSTVHSWKNLTGSGVVVAFGHSQISSQIAVCGLMSLWNFKNYPRFSLLMKAEGQQIIGRLSKNQILNSYFSPLLHKMRAVMNTSCTLEALSGVELPVNSMWVQSLGPHGAQGKSIWCFVSCTEYLRKCPWDPADTTQGSSSGPRERRPDCGN